jgi:hypothetical protein
MKYYFDIHGKCMIFPFLNPSEDCFAVYVDFFLMLINTLSPIDLFLQIKLGHILALNLCLNF